MSDYRVKVTFRNAKILRAIEENGYKSVAAFARHCGVHSSAFTDIIAMRKAPINKEGDFSAVAQRLMDELCALPEDLWTQDQLYMNLKRSSFEREVTGKEMRLLAGQSEGEDIKLLEDHIDHETKKAKLEKIIKKVCTGHQAKVLFMRFGMNGYRPSTLEAIAREIEATRERVRQVEQQALKNLRLSAFFEQNDWLELFDVLPSDVPPLRPDGMPEQPLYEITDKEGWEY